MSRLTETRRAYDTLTFLLDQEVRNRSGAAKELERFRETLDVAFYFLGWAQFEYLVRQESKSIAQDEARAKSRVRVAWEYLKDNIKEYPVRRRLDLIFHGNPTMISKLNKDYNLRNDIAHEYKRLPVEARDISAWLEQLEALVTNFQS